MIAPTCDYPGCAKLADVWWEGGWCSTHARAHGNLPALRFRFQNLHRLNQDAAGLGHPPFPAVGPPSEGPSSGRASVVASVTASEPSPLTEAELLDILERENWGTGCL